MLRITITNTELPITWLSAHLYYADPWTDFLKNAVYPFVQQAVKKEGLVQAFFFIRYTEKGPHIRLRLLGNVQLMEREVKPRLVTYFTDYYQQYPSSRQEPSADLGLNWYPDNSIQFMDYEPETERYGGPEGLLISERLFHASSQAVLQAMEESSAWRHDQAISSAVQMHLGMAFRLRMTLADAQSFFSNSFHLWMNTYLVQAQGGKAVDAAEIEKQEKNVRQALEVSFEKQQARLMPFFKTVWEALERREELEQDWYNHWLEEVAAAHAQLSEVQGKGLVRTPTCYVTAIPTTDALEATQLARWAIFDSHVHMTNNRLGIFHLDELYVYYLLKEAFGKLLLNALTPSALSTESSL